MPRPSLVGAQISTTMEKQPIKSWDQQIASIRAAGQIGTWAEITQEMYWEMLQAVPPAASGIRTFLCGEPVTHNEKGEAVYYSFRSHHPAYFATMQTLPEFRGEVEWPTQKEPAANVELLEALKNLILHAEASGVATTPDGGFGALKYKGTEYEQVTRARAAIARHTH